MNNGPILMTERLILRPPSAEDFEEWAAFHADAKTMRFLGGVQSRSVAWRGLCAMAGAWPICGFAMFSLLRRDTGQWIGRVGPWQPEGWPGAEIAWGLSREHEGMGFAQEAAIAAMDYAFDILRWDAAIHIIDPENTASIALALRLGSSNQGPTKLPAPFGDFRVDAYGQSRDTWKNARKKLNA